MLETTSLSPIFFQLNISKLLINFLKQSSILADLKILEDELIKAFEEGGFLQTKYQ